MHAGVHAGVPERYACIWVQEQARAYLLGDSRARIKHQGMVEASMHISKSFSSIDHSTNRRVNM